MGELISLTERRRQTALAGGAPEGGRFSRTTFFFDLALPQTYFAAERVERQFPGVRWQPADAETLRPGVLSENLSAAVAHAEARAAALGVPLVWPEPFPADVRPAMRVAAAACDLGRGAPFVLAAGRLAFCGGFDLRDPEVLAEAAAAAGLPLEVCLGAVGDESHDRSMRENARRLGAAGARDLPALRVGRVLFDGEERLPEALAAVAATGTRRSRQPATA